MPLSKGHKNKMKKWRRESPGNHNGRQLRNLQYGFISGGAPVATELLTGLLARAGIKMPKAEAFRDMLNRLKAEKEASTGEQNEAE